MNGNDEQEYMCGVFTCSSQSTCIQLALFHDQNDVFLMILSIHSQVCVI